MRSRRTAMVAFVAMALGGSVVASMAAWADRDEAVISGCYSNHTGALRIRTNGEVCRRQETAIEWYQQGPVGPAGPRGEQGPVGPQGPAGPEGPAGALAGRAIVTSEFTVPHCNCETTFVFTARCPAGKLVTGGGYEIEQAGVNEFRESHPEVTQPGVEGWSVGVGPDEDVDINGVVYAICVDG